MYGASIGSAALSFEPLGVAVGDAGDDSLTGAGGKDLLTEASG